MKRDYGTSMERLLWGGAKLTEVEFGLLESLVTALPPALRTIVEAQFEAYNLAQREVDGRALNFYRKTKGGKVDDMGGLPLLSMEVVEAPLVRLKASVVGETMPVHATLNAVKGRVFCLALDRPVAAEGKVIVVDVTKAWRSNFRFKDTG